MNISRRTFIGNITILSSLACSSAFAFGIKKKALPNVLILGDSISIGYTPIVKELLSGKAEVQRPEKNCQGTTLGLKELDNWLGAIKWDVIHFNFGLHDLKHVDATTGKNSNLETDPQQADLKQYKKNLQLITQRLKLTGAKLIFATTTPYPDKPAGPLRRSGYVAKYNKVALKIMKKNKVVIDDLYSFTLPRLAELQIPDNVHFKKEGNEALAKKVSESIENALNS